MQVQALAQQPHSQPAAQHAGQASTALQPDLPPSAAPQAQQAATSIQQALQDGISVSQAPAAVHLTAGSTAARQPAEPFMHSAQPQQQVARARGLAQGQQGLHNRGEKRLREADQQSEVSQGQVQEQQRSGGTLMVRFRGNQVPPPQLQAQQVCGICSA